MNDRREAARFRKLKSGKVSFDGARIPCIVRSISETGACLEVQTTHGLPGKFDLAIPGEGPKACTVTWANDNKLGVQFKS
jgi:hypothetical protein